ncbi:cupin domain-containing protein [Cysteiniphilum sp. JM-1]|uniref:cupin domain-containing protein n=1 Tax=Cysteiniphilum sp. JM-1 TaxID=2610891 RepID=UPI0012469B89|nr:cupin domain-containing protein [Cysteiniphilum sp. JM-1]
MNLYDIPKHAEHELFDIIHAVKNAQNLKIERIVSYGQITPKDKPYIQTQDELVFVLQGEATLLMDGTIHTLTAGESLLIPSNTMHWVTYTSPSPATIWLAIHFDTVI